MRASKIQNDFKNILKAAKKLWVNFPFAFLRVLFLSVISILFVIYKIRA
jgi:hypothetical protein